MVFTITIIIVALFAIWGAVAPDQLADAANVAYNFSIQNFGWFYLLATLFFLIFAFYLAFSRFGNIRLGMTMMNRNILRFPGCPCCLALVWALGWFSGELLNRCPTIYPHRKERYPKRHKPQDFQCVIPFSTGAASLGYLYRHWFSARLFPVSERLQGAD